MKPICTKDTKIMLPARHYGKKRYLLNPLLARLKPKPRKLPDYHSEEQIDKEEFD